MKRTIWLSLDQVPDGVKVIGIGVARTLAVLESEDETQRLMSTDYVFLEVSSSEFSDLAKCPEKIDQLVKRHAQAIALACGGKFVRWHAVYFNPHSTLGGVQ